MAMPRWGSFGLWKLESVKMCRAVLLWCAFLGLFVGSPGAQVSEMRTSRNASRYTMEDLLTSTFPQKVTRDLDMDPCKAGEYLGFSYK